MLTLGFVWAIGSLNLGSSLSLALPLTDLSLFSGPVSLSQSGAQIFEGVTAVGVISIVQIAVSGGGGSGNVSESVVTECAVGRRGREVGKSPGSEVLFASGIRRGCAQLRIISCFVFKLIR